MQGVIEGARALLQQLESTALAEPGCVAPPERVLAGMRGLQAALAAADPQGPEEMVLETPFQEEPAEERRPCAAPSAAAATIFCTAAHRGAASDTQRQDGDIWADLEISSDADDATIAEKVRKKARAAPY